MIELLCRYWSIQIVLVARAYKSSILVRLHSRHRTLFAPALSFSLSLSVCVGVGVGVGVCPLSLSLSLSTSTDHAQMKIL